MSELFQRKFILLISLIIMIIITISSVNCNKLPTYENGRKTCKVIDQTVGRVCGAENEQLSYVIYRANAPFATAYVDFHNYEGLLKMGWKYIKSSWNSFTVYFKTVSLESCREQCWEKSDCIGFRSFKTVTFLIIPQTRCYLINTYDKKVTTLLNEKADQIHMITCCEMYQTTPSGNNIIDISSSTEQTSIDIQPSAKSVQLQSGTIDQSRKSSNAWIFILLALVVVGAVIGGVAYVYVKKPETFSRFFTK